MPAPRYPSPIELALSADGAWLYVVCEGTDEVVVFNLFTGSIMRRIRGRAPAQEYRALGRFQAHLRRQLLERHGVGD